MRICFFCLLFLMKQAVAQDFPASFIGHWQGELEWFQSGKKDPMKVKMQLVIHPADTAGQYTWQIIYGTDSGDNRPYLLKPVDSAKGHWVIDERIGIVLDQYWVGNRLTSGFTVGKTTIINSYYLENGNLIAEFYSLSSEPVRTSGGTEDVPTVTSFATKGYQKAVLRKQSH